MYVVTVREYGWGSKKNGELLAAASGAFGALLTADRNISDQQNLVRYDLAVLVLEAKSNTLEDLAPLVPKTAEVLTPLVLRQLGHKNLANCNGSWNEWVAKEHLPTE